MNVIIPRQKLLMGPGPSNTDPRVLRAISQPTLGHLDPDFVSIMDQTTELLRFVFDTKNRLTIPVSGTGSAGMEAALMNTIEPGDKVIVCVAGVFGERMIDIAERVGAVVDRVSAPWGQPIDPDSVKEAIKGNPDAKLLCIVHAETSTGVLQPLKDIVEMAHEAGLRVVVDAVTSLGGVPVPVDELDLDFVYSGTQKCLNCPPGLSPITVNESTASFIRERKTKCLSWYLDLGMIQRYWGSERLYHHTAPVNMIYGLHEALKAIKEEGLKESFARHKSAQKHLLESLKEIGIKPVVKEHYRLPSLTTLWVPENVDEGLVRKRLLEEFNIEIGAGLGAFKGKVWRIGLMGSNATKANVVFLTGALKHILQTNI